MDTTEKMIESENKMFRRLIQRYNEQKKTNIKVTSHVVETADKYLLRIFRLSKIRQQD